MKDEKKKPWPVALVGALIGVVHILGDTQEDWVVLTLVAAVFLIGFGFMLAQGIREWKKSDEEILNEYIALFRFSKGKGERKLSGWRYLVVVAFFLLVCLGPVSMRAVFCVLALLCAVILMLVRRIHGEPDKADKREPWVRKIRQEAWVAIAMGIPTNGFFLFFAAVGTYHGVWWFVLPPAAIFMLHFLRGPVAGIRHIQRVRRGIDMEPWEKKDRILK